MIIAGPNGAGKTTFAREFLPNEGSCPHFINADLIAAGLSPFDPAAAAIQAGRLMLSEIDRRLQAQESFAFESTLSGLSYARQIPRWQSAGYRVELVFLKLRSVRLAVARVKNRVAQGGHAVPSAVVRRRFRRGWENFERRYRPLVDHWELYDNSGNQPLLLAKGDRHEIQIEEEP
jgi:predicted ABC-type ATPase